MPTIIMIGARRPKEIGGMKTAEKELKGNEKFLVTGAAGCIGSWVLRRLVREGVPTVATDLSRNLSRVQLLLAPGEIGLVEFQTADITDTDGVRAIVEENGITHIIHLAGLQVPFCKADPAQGGRVNVVGTVNLFEAARQNWGQVQGITYASSIAVLGPPELYTEHPIPDSAQLLPETLYGVYKMADERIAQVYWRDWDVGSVGLRPYVVYGVARDQGLTSDIAKAVLAAVAGRPFQIKFGGRIALQYADDCAELFIAAARASHRGSVACNLRNDIVDVGDLVSLITAIIPGAQVSYAEDQPLPFPCDLDDSGLREIVGEIPHTPLPEAIEETASMFRDLLDDGKIDLQTLS
jgi:nucleoside-diphosphate-sugar epimerase